MPKKWHFLKVFLNGPAPNQEFPKWASPNQEFLKWASPKQEFPKWASLEILNWASPFREFPIWAGPFQEFPVWAGPFQEFLIWAGPFREFPIWAGPFREWPIWAGPLHDFFIWCLPLLKNFWESVVFFVRFPLPCVSFWPLTLLYSDDMHILQKDFTFIPAWNRSLNILLPPVWSCHRLLNKWKSKYR